MARFSLGLTGFVSDSNYGFNSGVFKMNKDIVTIRKGRGADIILSFKRRGGNYVSVTIDFYTILQLKKAIWRFLNAEKSV